MTAESGAPEPEGSVLPRPEQAKDAEQYPAGSDNTTTLEESETRKRKDPPMSLDSTESMLPPQEKQARMEDDQVENDDELEEGEVLEDDPSLSTTVERSISPTSISSLATEKTVESEVKMDGPTSTSLMTSAVPAGGGADANLEEGQVLEDTVERSTSPTTSISSLATEKTVETESKTDSPTSTSMTTPAVPAGGAANLEEGEVLEDTVKRSTSPTTSISSLATEKTVEEDSKMEGPTSTSMTTPAAKPPSVPEMTATTGGGGASATAATPVASNKPPPVPSNSRKQQPSEDWLQQAVDLWVKRALSAIKNINKRNRGEPKPLEKFEKRLISETMKDTDRKKYKLCPKGMNPRNYIYKVLKELRSDPRLYREVWEDGTVLYWKGETESVKPSSSSSSFARGGSVPKQAAASTQKLYGKTPKFQESARKQVESSSFVPLITPTPQQAATSSQILLDAMAPSHTPAVEKSNDELSTISSRQLWPATGGRNFLADRTMARSFQQAAPLGFQQETQDDQSPVFVEEVFMNVHEPFCFAAIGMPGTGKSNTLACVMESCLVPVESEGIHPLGKPMTTLVLHYDRSTSSMCEAIGLLSPAQASKDSSQFEQHPSFCVPASKATVLVSPTYYRQRKTLYGDRCNVRPLLFKWSSLNASIIKHIMRIDGLENQFHIAAIVSLLRHYQQHSTLPSFQRFIKEVRDACSMPGHQGAVDQRIALLELVVADSKMNEAIYHEGMDISDAVYSGLDLIVADLTDPLLSTEEANCLFQVITDQFRSIQVPGGKLLALDEAHTFMDGNNKNDGLSETIVSIARRMHHEDMRVAVATQSPRALSPELLDLLSVAVLHHFRSPDDFDSLRQKLSVHRSAWECIQSLTPGDGLVFASRFGSQENVEGSVSRAVRLRIRNRITADVGANKSKVW